MASITSAKKQAAQEVKAILPPGVDAVRVESPSEILLAQILAELQRLNSLLSHTKHKKR